MSSKMIVDGELVEGDVLALDVRSPGFAYGAGVFETIKFKSRRPCFFQEHADRLMRAAGAARIEFDSSAEELYRQALSLFDANQVDEGIFKIVVSSSGSHSRLAVFVRNAGLDESSEPHRVLLSSTVRSSNAFASRHKTLNYMENWLGMLAAQEHGFDELLFLNEREEIAECAMSNVFFISDGILKTPSLECGLLDGVIRGQIIRLALEDGWRVEEGSYGMEELLSSEEIFLTNSGRGMVGVWEVQADRLVVAPVVGSRRVKRLEERLREAEAASMRKGLA